jgi:ribosomal protein L37AE/L43A
LRNTIRDIFLIKNFFFPIKSKKEVNNVAKILINCKKCGKEIKLDLEDTIALCKKCRKSPLVNNAKTTRFFEF